MAELAVFVHVEFWIGVLVIAGIYGIFTLGLQLNSGFTGIFNFGQSAFMAVSAYTVGLIVTNLSWPLWAALPFGIAAAVASGLLIGFATLRLRADYFAIATIAFAEIVRYIGQNAGFTGGNQGIMGFDGGWRAASEWALTQLAPLGLGGQVQLPLLILVWATFILATAILAALQRTPWGRVLRAIREDEDAASALGKNVFAYKLQSLTLAAALGAVAGFFLVLNVTLIYPAEFEPMFTFFGYAILVLGGFASYLGVAAGSLALWVLLEGTRLLDLPFNAAQVAALRFIIVGLVLILVMALRPQGVFGKRQEMLLGSRR